MGDMIAQDFLLGAPQRRAHGRDLRDDVDAIAVVLDHAAEAADLALDAFEPLESGRLDIAAHGLYVPPGGICFKGHEKAAVAMGSQDTGSPHSGSPPSGAPQG